MLNELNCDDKHANFIFHYTKTSHLLESILPDKQIRFSSLETTNDPLEFENFNHIVVSNSSVPRSETYNILEEGNKIVEIIKKVCKISCFSIDVNPNNENYLSLINRGYCLPRMWSQYGENHYGACLVFDKNELVQYIKDSKELLISENGEYQFFNQDITYDDQLTGLDNALTLQYEAVRGKAAIDIFKKNITPFLFTKYKNYEHEQEYRMVIYNNSFFGKNHIDVDYGNALKAVILGCRFKDTYIPSLKKHTDDRNIPIFQLQWFNGSPSILML